MKNNRIVLNSPRILELKRKKRKTFRNKMLFACFLVIVFFVGLSLLSRWPKININNIQISGNKIIESKMIEDIAERDISGNYLWVFPKSNFILYPKKEIMKDLALKFKRLKDISLNVENLSSLNISLTERTALYTYCGIAPDLGTLPMAGENSISNQKCYFIDDGGYIFDKAPYFSNGVYLKLYGKTITNGDDPSGSYFFQLYFKKLVAFNETLKEIDIKPVAFYIEDNGDARIILPSSSGVQTGPEIIFKLGSDYDQLAENLQSILTTEPLQSNFKNKYSSLEYIDLRFGNKVYYKFSDQGGSVSSKK